MRQALLIIACAILTGQLFSQTKLIAHKSHSGSARTFNISLVEELFSNPGSNFGDFPQRRIMTARLDSLIFLSDTTTVMVTSRVRKDEWTDSINIWKPGRDTVINHPTFSRRRGVDNIKRSLKQEYYFRNSADSVKIVNSDTIRKPKFINYEEPGRRNEVPLLTKPDHNQKPPFDAGIIICFMVAGVISFFAGIGYYSYMKIKSQLVN